MPTEAIIGVFSHVQWYEFSRLDGILSPKSIAVVGASTRLGTVGNDIFRNLLFCGFNGPVYPVNPKATQRDGRIRL